MKLTLASLRIGSYSTRRLLKTSSPHKNIRIQHSWKSWGMSTRPIRASESLDFASLTSCLAFRYQVAGFFWLPALVVVHQRSWKTPHTVVWNCGRSPLNLPALPPHKRKCVYDLRTIGSLTMDFMKSWRFLLSNLRFYMEEYRFDVHHGNGTGFSGGYHNILETLLVWKPWCTSRWWAVL
jgi:hypothetical protein